MFKIITLVSCETSSTSRQQTNFCCSDDDAKTNVTRLKHSGMPPVTPQACVKDNITGAAFDFIWAEVSLGEHARNSWRLSYLTPVICHICEDYLSSFYRNSGSFALSD